VTSSSISTTAVPKHVPPPAKDAAIHIADEHAKDFGSDERIARSCFTRKNCKLSSVAAANCPAACDVDEPICRIAPANLGHVICSTLTDCHHRFCSVLLSILVLFQSSTLLMGRDNSSHGDVHNSGMVHAPRTFQIHFTLINQKGEEHSRALCATRRTDCVQPCL